jgi:simple sugar transport system permease protein
MLLASILSGALWGAIVGALKAWRGAHEVVTSIMLNWISFSVAAYLVEGPFQAPGLVQQTLPLGQNATLPSLALLYNQTLGTFLPAIDAPTQYTVDAGLLIALVALLVYWFVTARTTFGYELRVIGQNPKAARYAGIPLKKNIIFAMALAGAFAGLAGSTRLMGQAPYQLISPSFATDNTGFNAIGVALLGRTTATGVLLAGLLFGALAQSGPYMQSYVNVPGDIIYIMQALVLFSISVEYIPVGLRFFARFQARSARPELVPNLLHVEAAEATIAPATVAESEPLGGDDVETVDQAATSTRQEG